MQNDLGPLPIDHREFLLSTFVRDMPPLAFKSYILLLCELWESGHLPRDFDLLARYSGVSRTVFRNKVWIYLAAMFDEVDEGTLDNEFTQTQRRKAVKALVARRKMSEAASRRAASR